MYLLTEWEGQIFSRQARPYSVNKHFITWPPRFSFFPFFFYFFFRVTKFGMLLILTEKSGFIQQQSCFSSLLARAIDKIPVWGPYAILAGPDGFFRTYSRHHVRPSYGDFLNSFAMKARARPYGSYNNPNYPPRCRWIVVEIYLAASWRGKYQPLFTSTSVNNR